jgi:hypothetical protein
VTRKGASVGKKQKKLHGTVQKIIKAVIPSETEKAEIEIHEGDDLYREIRVENVLKDQESGEEAHLKPGAEVDVIVEADSSATIKRPENT